MEDLCVQAARSQAIIQFGLNSLSTPDQLKAPVVISI